MKIKKLVIPAAGLGTRFLPITKSIAKEMLPILNVPTIQFIIEEALEAGLNEILIIVSQSKESIINYFDSDYKLENILQDTKKIKMYKLVKGISEMAKIYFIRQKSPDGLGDAISYAKTFCGKDPFAVILGDDIVFKSKPNELCAIKQCVKAYEKYHKPVLGVQEVDLALTNKYGIIGIDKKINDSVYSISKTVEKPIENPPSNLAIMGRYIFTPKIFDAIEKIRKNAKGEVQLTDAIEYMIANNCKYLAYKFSGNRFDAGSKLGYLQATTTYSLKDKDISDEYIQYLKQVIKDYENK